MSDPGGLDRRDAHRNAWFSHAGAAIALTGVQMIAPSLPAMRDALDLDETQLALVMSVYLLPAAIAAVPAGMLADRIGRRLVLGFGFIGFGICGVMMPLLSGSFAAFLSGRFDGNGLANPNYTDEYSQWDAIVSYTFENGVTLFAEGFNLTDEYSRVYQRNEIQTLFVTQTGRRWGIGARWNF